MKPETRQRREEEKQYEEIEGILAKAEDKGGRFFAISMMRTGFSLGDEAHKEAAASLVADRFRLSIREVREWYDRVLEQERLQIRRLLRRGDTQTVDITKEEMVLRHPDYSLRRLANMVNLSHETVRQIRKTQHTETGER